MIEIAKDEILLMLDGNVFFFNEEGKYTSLTAKEAKKKNFKNLFFDRNTWSFSYERPNIFFNENGKIVEPDTKKKKSVFRAILCLKEGDNIEMLYQYFLHYYEIMRKKVYPIQDLSNFVVRRRKNKYVYFNDKGKIEILNQNCIIKSNAINLIVPIDGKLDYSDGNIHHLTHMGFTNLPFLRMAYCKLKEGDTIEDLKRYYANAGFSSRDPLREIDYFVTKVGKPIFIRKPENIDNNSFDYIYIDLNLAIDWKCDKLEYYKENRKDIDEMAVKKIENSQSFKKYGIPINFLKISRKTFINQRRVLQYVFELKVS